jgi:ABC-type polysaccharide/polyol phosphate transport system ATPase subunit
MTRAVTVEHLWKSYHERPQLGIKEILMGRKPPSHGRFARAWALQDVSFEVAAGKAFGILGHNGTGKSTLLGVLLGTIAPDRGTVQVHARVASLLELGAGFHPELSGRENIFLYGSILGMMLAEIRQRFDQIIEFSELGNAIENPIRTYSNGMITRLGFSIIIHTPARMLLIDEILGVGDSRFQQKCMKRLMQFKHDGGTLIIVSHDMKTLSYVCDEGMCLNEGRVAKIGAIDPVIRHYGEITATQGNPAGTNTAGSA